MPVTDNTMGAVKRLQHEPVKTMVAHTQSALDHDY